MGSHKALLRFDENLTFLEKISNTYLEAGIEQVIVVINASLACLLKERKFEFAPGVEFVINANPEMGRFYSLQKGLMHLKPGHSCFFQNIDNPFTTVEVLAALIKYKSEADVIIPVFQNKSGHPVLFTSLVATKVLDAKDASDRIDLFLKKFVLKKVEVQEQLVLTNINSASDLLESGFQF